MAFYNDGTGTIVNYGTICTFGVCQSGNEYNNTDDFTSLIYTGGDTITRSGETVTLNKSAAVTDKLAGNVVNSGTVIKLRYQAVFWKIPAVASSIT